MKLSHAKDGTRKVLVDCLPSYTGLFGEFLKVALLLAPEIGCHCDGNSNNATVMDGLRRMRVVTRKYDV